MQIICIKILLEAKIVSWGLLLLVTWNHVTVCKQLFIITNIIIIITIK